MGRISPNKGLYILLESMDYLNRSVRLVVIGPQDRNSEYFNRIQLRIEKENKKGKHEIKYLGKKNQDEIVEWYQKASIFVLTTIDYEALGIVNLEALAWGTPVIATNVGGVSEAVRDGSATEKPTEIRSKEKRHTSIPAPEKSKGKAESDRSIHHSQGTLQKQDTCFTTSTRCSATSQN